MPRATHPRATVHRERHATDRIGWLRAAVLGANDGIVSTSALMVGVAGADSSQRNLMIAGVAGLVSGALSMAAGEYVSVSSQRDAEQTDLATEEAELRDDPEGELAELTNIYRKRGLTPDLAEQVAKQLTEHDALAAHAHDELGINEVTKARPLQAAFASAASFSAGAIVPIIVALIFTGKLQPFAIGIAALLALGSLGFVSARVSNSALLRPVTRVVFWGAVAMIISWLIGSVFGGVTA